MVKDLLKYAFALVAVTVGFYLSSLVIFDEMSFQSLSLSKMWREDITNLEVNKLLPISLNDIREVEWVTPDEKSKVWAKYLKSPFSINPMGQYRLEILLLSQNDSGLVAVIQHHLIHIPSGNSVWELGRTYTLNTP